MTNNYPTGRKSPVRLTDDENYTIYKFCIENMCISQIENAVSYRMDKKKIASEINLLSAFRDRNISHNHVTGAVESVIKWQEMLGKKITVQESVELDQLKIYKTRATKEIEDYKLAINGQKEQMKLIIQENERLKKSDAQAKIERIRLIVSV